MQKVEPTNYLKYRGKCKEYCEALYKEKGYRMVRGWYYDPIWNREEAHWWCVDSEGRIHDPTSAQFPFGGIQYNYREFDGFYMCEQCGKQVAEEKVISMGNSHIVCSSICARQLVGV